MNKRVVAMIPILLIIVGLFALISIDSRLETLEKPHAFEKPSNLPILEGYSTWYSTRECHAKTASGEPLDDKKLTCACWLFDFDTQLRVLNLKTGKSVIVRVNDRGPNRRFVTRIIDLSKAAFESIGDLSQGKIRVRVTAEEI